MKSASTGLVQSIENGRLRVADSLSGLWKKYHGQGAFSQAGKWIRYQEAIMCIICTPCHSAK